MKQKNLIIDCRIRKIELEFLSKFFNVIKLPLSDDVYEEISGHSDIFYTNINNNIICAPNCKYINEKFKVGFESVGELYPNDVKYNACQIGSKVIGSRYLDNIIKPDILVKQGYVKCSIAVTSDSSCITSDKKICEILMKNNLDSIYVNENNICLLKKDSSISTMRGFIGGASLVFDGKFILFGDSNKLKCKEQIVNHLNKYNLELIDFKGLDIYDYGGGIIFD